MNKELDIIGFENENMRRFAEELYEEMPDYWHHVPASSTGKYHPQYALGDGGLKRHTFALLKILNYILGLDYYKNKYTSEERDAFRIAGLVHDGWKSGTQEQYNVNHYTKFDHPIIAANQVYEHRGTDLCSDSILNMICRITSSHMGQWNTDSRSNIVLPVPEDDYQALLHVCDYLASRKDIEVKFDDDWVKTEPEQQQTKATQKYGIDNYQMPFGKYKGTPIKEVPVEYLKWLKDNAELRAPLVTYINELLAG